MTVNLDAAQRGLKQFALPQLPIVAQPTLSVVMAGHLRLQVPCSKEVQAIFDLMSQDAKMEPNRRLEIQHEADLGGQMAVKVFEEAVSKSPQLRVVAPAIGINYAIVDGKLFYIYMLQVRSA